MTKKQGVSRIQRHADGVASTTPPLFTTKPHRLHVPYVMVTPDMTFTSWSQHRFVAIAESQRQGRRASHNDSKQQWKSHAMLALTSCSRHTHIQMLFLAHIPFVVHRACDAAPTARPQQYDADLCLNHCCLNILRKIRQFSAEADSLFFLRCCVCSAQT